MDPGQVLLGAAFMRIGSGIAARIIGATLPWLGVCALAGLASAQTLVGPDIELLEGSLVAASAPVLSNDSGTLHIESATLGEFAGGYAAGPSSGIQLFGGTVPIPEPAALLQLGSGALGLMLLERRRRLRLPSRSQAISENS